MTEIWICLHPLVVRRAASPHVLDVEQALDPGVHRLLVQPIQTAPVTPSRRFPYQEL
jgi:hypothetical protein